MISNPKIAIVDYGVGNLYSLVRAFKFFNADVVVTEDQKILEEAGAVVLPGVGSFQAGMKGLEVRGLTDSIKKTAHSQKPLLGICLGAQILMSEGHEFGVFKGLDIIQGKVVRFPSLANNEKVPHIGWNTISLPGNKDWKNTIFDSFKEKNQVYFVHSYILEPESQEESLAFTTYGKHTFCSAIKKGNTYGCQFHPEKSGQVGLQIIKNFINIVNHGNEKNR